MNVHTSSRLTIADVDVDAPEGSNGRGSTYGQRARKMKKHIKGRLTVEFNFTLLQAICDNAEMFNNEIGYIVRKNCSFQYKEWRFVPSTVKAPLCHKLLVSKSSFYYFYFVYLYVFLFLILYDFFSFLDCF